MARYIGGLPVFDVVVRVPFLGSGSFTLYILGVFDVLDDFALLGALFIVISPI